MKDYKGDTFKVGKTGKVVKMGSNTLEHILVEHHLKYWKGEKVEGKTFFDPDISIKKIWNYIQQTINSNSKHIVKRAKGKDKSQIIVYKKINKVNYKLRINIGNKKTLTVSSFYPAERK